ncbi:MAG TPA: hypothetical protein VK453_11225 [Micromonosporaceae bacterium]|nr:hypothetical protein [Micromonosporaceae bacterium]
MPPASEFDVDGDRAQNGGRSATPPGRRIGRRTIAIACAVAIACAAMLTLGIWIGGRDGDDVKVMAETDVTRRVHQYAEEAVGLLDNLPLNNSAEVAAKCDKDGGELFYVQGTYQVPMPIEEHFTTLAQIRDQWAAKGYQVTNQHNAPEGTGTVTVTIPDDGYTITMQSAKPPQAFELLVRSACYRAPASR